MDTSGDGKGRLKKKKRSQVFHFFFGIFRFEQNIEMNRMILCMARKARQVGKMETFFLKPGAGCHEQVSLKSMGLASQY